MNKSLAIVIPIYNEGSQISHTIDQIFSKVSGNYHVYLVYDMEEDSSLPYIKKYNDQRLIPLRNKYGKGVLNAIKTGLETSKEDNVVVFMADMSEDPVYINDMVKKAEQGFELVCGSRYMRGGAQIGAPRLKSFLSRMAGLSLRIITGIPTFDISNSFKLYSRKLLNDTNIESTGGFELGLEILVKSYLKGYKIAEIPVIWKEREKGVSRFRLLKWLPKYLKWYFYLIKNTILRFLRLD